MFSNFAALAAVKDDAPKKPPSPATPLQFPKIDLGGPQNPPTVSFDKLYKTLISFPRQGPTVEHLKIFNIQLAEDVPLENLIPQNYLPSSSWLVEPGATVASDTSPAVLLSNGAPAPDQSSFYTRLHELLYQNDDAFDVLKRKALPPEKQVRLSHFRKFWDKLYAMAEYWDTSKDNYMPPSPTAGEEQRYTGRRIDCGSKMPNTYREAAVHAFVETITWSFKCRVKPPSIEQKLGVQMMRIPVPQSGFVCRTPSDRARARRGILEGPLASITCRVGVEIRKEGEKEDSGRMECLDLLREIGSVLLLVQKRRKEGTAEVKPWEGQWWAEKPRWGGSEDGEVASCDPTSSDPTPISKDRKNLEQWKKLKPPSSEWDQKVEYMQIGKRKQADHDTIYILSSLNHHLSILRVRVPDAYIDLMTNGPPSSPAQPFIPAQHPWFKLQVKRSKWYDFLKAEDRAQAMRGVWGVMRYMMRDVAGDDLEEEEDGDDEGKGKGKGEGEGNVEMTDQQ